MVFNNESKINIGYKPKEINRKYPVTTPKQSKSCFYNKSLSQSFKGRFSFEPYKIKSN